MVKLSSSATPHKTKRGLVRVDELDSVHQIQAEVAGHHHTAWGEAMVDGVLDLARKSKHHGTIDPDV
jgi:hypothetical protein